MFVAGAKSFIAPVPGHDGPAVVLSVVLEWVFAECQPVNRMKLCVYVMPAVKTQQADDDRISPLEHSLRGGQIVSGHPINQVAKVRPECTSEIADRFQE